MTKTCIACGSSDLMPLETIDVTKQHQNYSLFDKEQQLRLTEAAKASSLNYQMIRCQRCNIEFADPLIAPNATWYDLAYQVLDLYPAKRWEYDFVLKQIQDKGLLLELGCGSGEFLKVCNQNGIQSLGLDFSPEAIETCTGRGLNANVFDLTKESPKAGLSAKTITAFHVLEHLDKPETLFEFAKKVANPSTTLWIAIPSNVRPTRILKEVDFLDQPPHHMTRWAEASLKEIGIRNGWELEKIHYEPLTLKSGLWWITTRMPPYRYLVAKTQSKKIPEQLIRLLLFPLAVISRVVLHSKMRGFTMLAQYHLK